MKEIQQDGFRFRAWKLSIVAGILISAFCLPIGIQADAVISTELTEKLAVDGEAEFFVVMSEKADLKHAYTLKTKLEKGWYVFNTLTEIADRSQAEVRKWLDENGYAYRPFWVSNKILVTGDLHAVTTLAARDDVSVLRLNQTYQAIDPKTNADAYDAPAGRAVEWNLLQIRADDVWSTWGITGSGIVVMGADTGVDWDHPALIDHYRGWDGAVADHNYNWFDATGTYPTVPDDGHGHGTHTVGTMVGDDGGANQIGVAPGAQWIGFKNMTNSGSGDDATFTKGFEWAIAPTDLNDANPNPVMAPHVINNSWGYWGGNDPEFEDETAACRAAGIMVEVSSGNEGSSCATLRSPSDYFDVFTTGSTDLGGGISGFSSRGPSDLYPDIEKPEVVAPGDDIRSSVPGGGYEGGWSGTSMAGPHTCGLAALIWSATPGLIGDITGTEYIIEQTAISTINGSCPPWINVPNNVYGWGEINCFAAVGTQYGTPIPTQAPTSTPTPVPTVPACAILVVDDDNNAPDVRSYFTDALTALGYFYNVYDVGTGSGNGPDAAWMGEHDAVVWFSGDAYGGPSAGPNSTDEGQLTTYLDGGGRLFLSSQDYLYDMTLTSFGSNYLGIASYDSDNGDATVKYGVSGDPVGHGLGPYTLSYPGTFTDYGDIVEPILAASTAFTSASGGGNNLDIDYSNGAYKTVFFGTSFVPVAENSAANGDELMQAIMTFLDICDQDTPTPMPTNTPTPLPTDTPVPPTDTPVPPTDTPTPLPTDTPIPPTDTPVPPTDTPLPCIHHGDVNFSDTHTAMDAQLTFLITVGVYTPNFDEACAADCNGDGSVTATDAQLIFGAVFGGSCVDPIS